MEGQINLWHVLRHSRGVCKPHDMNTIAQLFFDCKWGSEITINVCHFLTGRHCVAMTKTRRAFIIILEQTYNSRKRPPCFLILADVSAGGRSRAPSPPRVRVSLSVVLGQCILESLVTQTPLHLTNRRTPFGFARPRATMTNGYFI